MKKKKLFFLKIVVALIVLILIASIYSFWYVNKTFISFEDGYDDRTDILELTIDGYTFLDRNSNNKLDIYEDDREAITDRVLDVLSQMTLQEKIHLLKGAGMASTIGMTKPGGIPGAVGAIVPTPRLGIPTVHLSDGPAGLRIEPSRENDDKTYYCTAFPIATLLASSWNETLVYEVGNAMGREAKAYGIDVILGPAANIHRHPLCGRNFEYFSEDPLLSGFMGASIVNGIQSNGIGTSVKHFVANNQETNRVLNDVIISDRAMHEIYLKGFEHIVKRSQPWTIMSSYNKINGVYTSESEWLLTNILRNEWGFKGLVMTDWFGGKSPSSQISAGNDLLEPGTNRQWKALTKAVKNEELSMDAIDKAAKRILTLIFKTKKMQNYRFNNSPDLKKHAGITRNSAAEGMILLKNENSLPFTNEKNIALLGITSYEFIAGGTGSGDVNEAYTISLEEGFLNAGFKINKTAKKIVDLHRKVNADGFVKPQGLDAIFSPFSPPEISYTTDQINDIVATSDVGVLTIGRNSGEGGDRIEKDDFLLTKTEQEMILKFTDAFHKKNKKIIVVLNIGGVIETASWKYLPDAILLAWQGGQEGGNSVVDILSGKINPSGKLPMTFPKSLSDHASHSNFPKNPKMITIEGLVKNLIFPPNEAPEKLKVKDEDYTFYDEGIFVGYRHFDSKNLSVSFPFGFGLSYTDFEYGPMKAKIENDTINISLNIKNIGEVSGKEVVQFYTEKINSTIERPLQELKAFAKTKLIKSGEDTRISVKIAIKELSYWDEKINNWSIENGSYTINAGASSRNIKQTLKISI
jgi:beta-glucosidase